LYADVPGFQILPDTAKPPNVLIDSPGDKLEKQVFGKVLDVGATDDDTGLGAGARAGAATALATLKANTIIAKGRLERLR
jgi:hypothetical protein